MSNKPRCMEPMRDYLDNGVDPVCWRPAGHKPGWHQSYASWKAQKIRRAKTYLKLLEKKKSWA